MSRASLFRFLRNTSIIFTLIVRNVKLFHKIFTRQKIFKESAALTFVTLMGFVPFIIFSLFLIPSLPFMSDDSSIKEVIISVFVPSSADQIVTYIEKIIQQKASFNIFNFVMLLLTSFALFRIINDTFDTILNVHESRKKDFLFNFIKFLGTIIFGFLIILLLFSAMSFPILSNLFNVAVLQVVGVYIIPFVLLFLMILLFYLFVPTIKIKKKSIVIAAALSSIIWFFIKFFFNWYVNNLTNMQVIYGLLATIPIFIFWIYINWTIILGGVVIVSMLEKRYLKHKEEDRSCESSKLKITIEGNVDEEIIYRDLFKVKKRELISIFKELLKDEEI